MTMTDHALYLMFDPTGWSVLKVDDKDGATEAIVQWQPTMEDAIRQASVREGKPVRLKMVTG